MNRFVCTAAVLLMTAAFPVFGKVSFNSVSVNESDEILFTVSQTVPGTHEYNTLFTAKLGKDALASSPRLLTCFPEKMELVQNGSVLQIRNRYGSAWYSPSQKKLSWVSSSDSLPVAYSRTSPQSVSPDGNYACFVRQSKSGSGQLILQNMRTQAQVILAESVSFSFDSVAVKWSPDSDILLYEKNGAVYFISASTSFGPLQISERLRRIGEGTIASVSWTQERSLLYIDGDIIYRINQNELYTRGLYSSLAGTGTIVGRLPYTFDSSRDVFWSDASGLQIVVVSQNNLVSYYSLSAQSYDFVQSKGIFTLTGARGAVLGCQVFWNQKQQPLLWVDFLLYEDGKRSSRMYALSSSMDVIFEVKDSVTPVASPDSSLIAFTGGESVYVFDINAAQVRGRLRGEPVVSFVWGSNTLLYVGGTKTVRSWNLRSEEVSLLFLSSVDEAVWSGSLVYGSFKDETTVYAYNSNLNTWTASSLKNVSFTSVEKNARYRVFIGNSQNKMFENAAFVRSLQGAVVTYPVFAESDVCDTSVKRVAVVFDALDRADGLPQVLCALNQFKIPATFFINGEFVRRYPSETRQIVASGYECASGFFTLTDLTSAQDFVIDDSFIKRGLARNEDEFYDTTGTELSLLWHAPLYKANASILSAGEAAGYRYVDTVVASDNVETLIEKIVPATYDGMIIPVCVGTDTQKIDLLISSLLDSGCTIVDVREFIE